jgi:lysophospholipase L1-like esterase
MRIRLLSLPILMMLCGAVLAHANEHPTLLALGDSLSLGVQPSLPSGTDAETNLGYANDLYAALRLRVLGLELVKLGCSDETTLSMIYGGVCNTYAEGSQLAAAENFLIHNKVYLVTLDIGANDVDQCIVLTPSPTIDDTCVTHNIKGYGANPGVGANLAVILAGLKNAIAEGVNKDAPPAIIGMNYYDPLLAALKLVPGTDGKTLAADSLAGTTALNDELELAYGDFGIPVADVADAFLINNTTLVGNLPLDAWVELTLTWIGAPPPVGPNVHPNDAGYLVIARAFADKVK